MALAPGTRLGPYEIGPVLGQGGMGEVYRARDHKLRRDVALKILPTPVAADADRLARFRREAHVLASLNHPHIAQIYGLEDGDTPALVLELVDGPTLADRIAAGPLSVLEALRVARQIAEALEAAHALDIIHRDLKPANVKVRPDGAVKVLDFGLAKGGGPSIGADSGVTTAYAATALGAGLTTPGAIIGTAAYMSPEQAAGQAADKRSDIWSFGVVLFEMLTGRRTFNGDSFAHVLAAVMRSEPDWTALPAGTPPSIRTLMRRALDKDRRRRLADIHDAWLEIDDALSAPPSAAPNAPPTIVRRRSVARWLAAALTIALSIVVVLWAPWRATTPVDRPPMRLNVDLGLEAIAGQSFDVAISPDATRLAFPARSPDGKTLLATRLLSEPTQSMLPGTEGARAPFFSPDGQWIGFAAGGQIRKVAVQGGAVVSVCDAVNVLGATWAEGHEIVFGRSPFFPLLRVSSNGGKPEPVTKTGELGDATHRWPQALPGGHAILFTSHKIVTGFDDASVEAVTMSSGARKMLVRGGYAARFASTPDGNGYLLYVRNGTLFAAPFDLESLAVRGAAVPVLENVAGDSDSGAGAFDVSRNGTIVYKSGQGPARTWQVVWLDSTGKTEPMIETPGTYYTPRMSPDGTRVALTIDRGDKGREIAVYDWHRGVLTQLTFTGEVNLFPVWSPDGRYIVFESSSPKGYGIGLVHSDGSGGLQRLGENMGLMIPSAFSPNGKLLAYNTTNASASLWVAPFDASDPGHPRLGTPRILDRLGGQADFSPSGRWVAYHSSESGRQEVYVRPTQEGSGKIAISTSGAGNAMWDRAGQRLFFRAADGRLMVVDYLIKGDVLSPGAPRVWCGTVIGRTPFGRDFSLSADGTRFVVFPSRDPDVPAGSVHVMFAINVLDRLRSAIAGVQR